MNTGTVVAALLLAAAVVLVIIKLIKDRKKGRRICGGSCSGCAMRGSCHEERKYD